MAKIRKDGLKVELTTAKRAVALLAKQRAKSHFGNVGAVEIMLSSAKMRMQQKACGSVCDQLTAEDCGVELGGPDEAVLETLFDDMVGCDQIEEKLESLRATVLFAKGHGDDPRDQCHSNTS
jgi:hypothetical protein